MDVIKSKNRKYRLFFTRENEDYDSKDFNHPGAKLESKEEMEKIFREINKLPEKQKTALILKTIEGIPQKEIATVMKMNEKAVESLLTRARKKLKEKL